MKRARWILLFVFLALLLAIGWLIWSRPKNVDMAAYAPPNTLLYIEANDPLSVLQAVVGTDAWRIFDKSRATFDTGQNSWIRWFVKTTGIGPIKSVILTRSQIAVVVTEVGTIQESTTLRVKPEAAVIIETHTSETRIRNVVEQTISELAHRSYGEPKLRRTFVNGIEFLEWRNQDASRRIVAVILGSLVVVGNSEPAVQQVLNSARRQAGSLKDDGNLHRLRRELAGPQSLTFGYVPQEKSARLLSLAIPLVLGRAPDDAGFQRVIATASGKLLGSIAWGSRKIHGGIEDRYLVSLQPSLRQQLTAPFSRVTGASATNRSLPENPHSVTYYRFEEPAVAWEGLMTSVSSSVDALSAVVFSSLMKSALLSYGVDEPEAFLRSTKGDILTLRLDREGEHTMLIAGIRDREALRGLLGRSMKIQKQSRHAIELYEDGEGQMAASLSNDLIALGTSADIRRYAENNMSYALPDEEEARRVIFFAPLSTSSPILTYTDDSDRVRRFLSAIMVASGTPAEELVSLEPAIAKLPYAATETRLAGESLERITRSPLGQFSTFLPLLFPDERAPQRPVAPSRQP
jgi:hypothetical protein